VIGTAEEEEAQNKALRWSAMALGAVMLPLTAVAAVSTGLRIGQHGFTPSRLWAIVFIAIALACAALYLYALGRGRLGWAARVRPANVRLAIGICALGLILATPLVDFGALSTQSQLARLEAGEVTPSQFDWRAMRFDFGPSGVAALQRLKAEARNPESRRLAGLALAAQGPWDLETPDQMRQEAEAARNLRVLPAGAQLPDALRQAVLREQACTGGQVCVILLEPAAHRAVAVSGDTGCPHPIAAPSHAVMFTCGNVQAQPYYLNGTRWSRDTGPALPNDQEQARVARLVAALRGGTVEVREVQRRQVFVDGRPVGGAFE
jgi:hypothetical protein